MIRKVRLDAGNFTVNVSLDENYFVDNTWKKTTNQNSVFPSSGIWKMGHNYNSGYLYLLDSNGDSILYFSNLGKNVGDRGLAMSLINRGPLAKDLILGWEITSVKKELFGPN